MKKYILSILLILLLPLHGYTQPKTGKARLIILADMGNESDEEQQMMHMLMCSNEFDLEGLIAVTGKYLRPESPRPFLQVVHPELFLKLIEGYERVHANLTIHDQGYPDPDYLRSIVASGQAGYGIADTGEGKSSEGSDLIFHALEKDDPRPIYVVVNAGSNTLAQALKDFERTQGTEEADKAADRLRVFENGAQDNSGAWICHRFPEIHWVRSNYQTYCYGGPSWDGAIDGSGKYSQIGPYTWEPYEYSPLGQHQWALEHIIGGHGPLGKCWPIRTTGRTLAGEIIYVEGGGTIPWLGLVNKGLSDYDHPWWGGWSGRFTSEKVKNEWSRHESVRVDEVAFDPFFTYTEAEDTWTNPDDGQVFEGNYVPVWRWRRAFFNDFKCRMDWCIAAYDEANHHPHAVVNSDESDKVLRINTKPGEKLRLDASGSSDPDGDDLEILWWCYREAGTYEGLPGISPKTSEKTFVSVPKDASGSEIHIILEISDKSSIASLRDYRRIILTVD